MKKETRDPIVTSGSAAAAAAVVSAALLVGAPIPARAQTGQVNVLTYHNDLARTGQDLNETLLTHTRVTSSQFGKLFSHAVDGQVYTQPLYLAGVSITGKGRHNVMLLATEHDGVYAFDADSAAAGNADPLWQVSFVNGSDVVPVLATDISCTQIAPEIGITGTPAIDVNSGTIYVVAMTKETTGGTTRFVQRLHALDIASGAERAGSPVEIQATIAGTSPGEGNGTTLTFNPRNYKERTGLLLLNGVVYTCWASHCDINSYHGWIMGYDAKTLQQVSVYNNTPNSPASDDDPNRQNGASFWASGAAPAVDANGNIYVISANGTYNPDKSNFGNCFLRLVPSGNTLINADYFAPFNQLSLNNTDLDTGSSGAVLLPDSVGSGAHPHLLVSVGKEGRIYLLDRDNLGHQATTEEQGGTTDTNAVQSLPGLVGALFGIPAYWNGNVYFSGVDNAPKAFSISNGLLSTSPTSQASQSYSYPGSVPSISANGTADGIVWTIQNTGVLHAYDATNLGTELYNSSQAGSRDSLGSYVKFSVPTITDGRVYVGTTNTLATFGLLIAPTPAADVTAQVSVTRGGLRYVSATGHYVQLVTVTNTGSNPITGPISLVLDNLSSAARLVSGGGVTTSYAAPTASFYQNALAGGSLAPGQSASFPLEFAEYTPQLIGYTTRVLAGSGPR